MVKIACFLFLAVLISSCTTDKPVDYFNRAILNTNMMVGFGGDGMQRELASPSIRLNKDGSTSAISAGEVLQQKKEFISSSLEKIKALQVTDETRAMIDTSVTLHQLVLEACNNEYKVLASLYDNKGTAEQIEAQAMLIRNKYHTPLTTLHNALTRIGKEYAARHNIPVQWDIRNGR